MEVLQRESAKKDEAVVRLQSEKKNLLRASAAVGTLNLVNTYDEVKGRQKSRKMKTIRTSAEQALSFVKSFGLDVEKLVLTSQKEGKVIINLTDCPSISTGTENVEESYTGSESVAETLYLLEKFGVSDEFYHKLTMLHPELPRSYIVKAARRRASDTVELLTPVQDCHQLF